MKLLLSRIAEFLQASGQYDGQATAQGYSIDSRTVLAGEVFFAVKGERLDGHAQLAFLFDAHVDARGLQERLLVGFDLDTAGRITSSRSFPRIPCEIR